MRKHLHVVPHPDGWAVKKAGNSKATEVVATQAEAIAVARKIAIREHSEVRIHRPNGQIREGLSFGHDPYPPEG